MVISRRAAAIATSSGVIDQEYLDETLEPNRKSQILDVLWRSGRQGVDEEVLRQRLAHQRGDRSRVLSRKISFVTRDGLEYAKQWKFQVSNSVLQGATVWEIETSSSEEEEVQILERPAAKARPTPKASEPVQILARPAAKARPTSKASGPVDYPTGSSSSSVVPEAKSSGTNQLGARAKPAAKAIERILRPRLYLPDTVVWFDRGNKAEDIGSGPDPVGVNFKEVSNYSAYRGYQ